MTLLTKGNYKIVKEDCLEWLKTINEPIKFCYIDASHEYDSVKRTIDLLLPHVVKGGVLCGDDWLVCPDGWINGDGGVQKAVKDTLPNYYTNGNNLWYWIKE